MSNPTKRVFVEAKASIAEEEKWGQGSRPNRPGTLCASEAITQAELKLRATGIDPHHLFRRVISDCSIVLWNDNPKRTHAEVLAAFDKAIAIAEVA